MSLKSRIVTYFAWFSIAQAAFHLCFELYAHVLVGQTIPSLIADLLAVGLPTLGAIGLLKWGWGPGPLCGGWGFEFCLFYRSWVWRVDEYMEGNAAPFLVESIEFLSPLLGIAAAAFALAVYFCVTHQKGRELNHELSSWVVALLIAVLAGVVVRLAYKLILQLPSGDVGPLIVFMGAAIPAVVITLRALGRPRDR